MAMMVIGGHTCSRNPLPDKDLSPIRYYAKKGTYTSVAFFSWGVSIVGKEVTIVWDYMSKSEYDALQAIYVADNEIVWDPKDGSSKSYNVQILDFYSTYVGDVPDSAPFHRKDAKMDLLIMSEV